jgi:tRNA (guanine37-N1)-methyltransferase
MTSKKITISIITLFPKFTDFYTSFGIISRAIKKKLLAWRSIDLRSFGLDARKTVDDRPYGGGVGMVLRPDVLHKAISFASRLKIKDKGLRIVLLTPSGKRFTQKDAVRLAKYEHLIFVSGRYEGYDERITKFVDEELSIGDYVLMGGELPGLVISEAVLRNIPGVLGKDESAVGESFSEQLLEYPQYTKPEKWKVKSGKYKGKTFQVPDVLLTGHHANVKKWRADEALKRTKKHRPDLLSNT